MGELLSFAFDRQSLADMKGSSMNSKLRIPTIAALLIGAAVLTSGTAEAARERCIKKSVGKEWVDEGSALALREYAGILRESLHGKFAAYATMLQDASGRRLYFGRAGWGVSMCDDRYRDAAANFTLDTKAVWGSVSKIITTAAVLAAIQDNARGKPAGNRYDEVLRPMKSLLPERWAAAMHASFEDVTLAHLLQHRAGFGDSDEHIRKRLRGGVELPTGVGFREYSNTSMGIFHFILAKLVDPQLMRQRESELRDASNTVYDSRIQDTTAAVYVDYVQRRLLRPLGIEASCNPREFPKGEYSIAYVRPRGTTLDTAGALTPDNSRTCAPGGWVMSIKDMMSFLHHLHHTDRLLQRGYYNFMVSPGTPGSAFGWNYTIDTKGGISWTHNGAINVTGGQGTYAQVIGYPNGYIAAFVANSPQPSVGYVLDSLEKAYNSSLRAEVRRSSSTSDRGSELARDRSRRR
jgi:CubicO group peptidase (beta-lactamase class C family)